MDSMLLETTVQSPVDRPRLSMCVVTRDRTDVLRRCLEAMRNTLLPGIEAIVSDDSRQPEETIALCSEYPFVRYTRGPQRGLCANRNEAIRVSRGNYLSFLDDDGVVGPDFFRSALQLISDSAPDIIFSGDLLEGDPGVLQQPAMSTFWGHFAPAMSGHVSLIHLNCNLVPRAAFTHAAFDESIIYGYEDMDLCEQFVAAGYHVEHAPSLLNQHIPPPKSADTVRTRQAQTDQARFYTSLKRYRLFQKKPLLAAAYFAFAPLHRAVHAVRHGWWHDIPQSFRDMADATRAVADVQSRGSASGVLH